MSVRCEEKHGKFLVAVAENDLAAQLALTILKIVDPSVRELKVIPAIVMHPKDGTVDWIRADRERVKGLVVALQNSNTVTASMFRIESRNISIAA
ncbi:MAG: hypothetical protein QF775_00480 [archaeon]|jgi:hypothetical protein|nr:hypothetical protein [archaeon]